MIIFYCCCFVVVDCVLCDILSPIGRRGLAFRNRMSYRQHGVAHVGLCSFMLLAE